MSSTTCPNCGASAPDAYCSACGQEVHIRRVSFWTWLKDFVEEQFSISAKLPGTLTLLFRRPGFLTAEWRAGRRVRYVEPLRLFALGLFLLMTVLFTFGSALRPIVSVLPANTLHPGTSESGEITRNVALIADELRRFILITLLFLVPAVAGGLKLMYRRRDLYFVEHLVFSLHFHAAMSIALAMALLIGMADRDPAVPMLIGAIVGTGFSLYLFSAIRRVYGGGDVGAGMRTIGVAYIYATMIWAMIMVRWPNVERRIIAEYMQLADVEARELVDARAYRAFVFAMRLDPSHPAGQFQINDALRLQDLALEPWRRLYQSGELHLMLNDTAMVRRIVDSGLLTNEQLPFLSLRARLHERRGETNEAWLIYQQFLRLYTTQPTRSSLQPYTKVLEWTAERARSLPGPE